LDKPFSLTVTPFGSSKYIALLSRCVVYQSLTKRVRLSALHSLNAIATTRDRWRIEFHQSFAPS
jgi:hypothetical protein